MNRDRPDGLADGEPPGSPTRLERPPSARYVAERSSPERRRPPTLIRSAILGLLMAFGTALGHGALAAIFGLGLGLLVIAAIRGWLIGWAVRWGAWPDREAASPSADRSWSRRVAGLAAVLAALSGAGAIVAEYLVTLAVLPQSSHSLAERIASTPFTEWLVPQLGSERVLEIVLGPIIAVVVAWRTADDPASGERPSPPS